MVARSPLSTHLCVGGQGMCPEKKKVEMHTRNGEKTLLQMCKLHHSTFVSLSRSLPCSLSFCPSFSVPLSQALPPRLSFAVSLSLTEKLARKMAEMDFSDG